MSCVLIHLDWIVVRAVADGDEVDSPSDRAIDRAAERELAVAAHVTRFDRVHRIVLSDPVPVITGRVRPGAIHRGIWTRGDRKIHVRDAGDGLGSSCRILVT